jgi:hypothetical protein
MTHFPKRWTGTRNHRYFVAKPKISFKKTKRRCTCCKRPVRRSHKTGILWPTCFTCRYLKMIYGPNISVEWVEDAA